MYHLERAFFAIRAEGLLHIDAAQRFPKLVIGEGHATLPARLLFFGSRQGLTIEIEVLVDERFRQKRRFAVYVVPSQVVLHSGCIAAGDDLFKRRQVVRWGYIHHLELRRADVFQVGIPIERRRKLRHFPQGHLVIHLHRVAARGDILRRLGEGGFQFHHRCRCSCRLGGSLA